jgi:predicted ATP-dependent endonuclease of OLD family
MISLIYKYLELSTEGSQLSDSKKMSGPLPVTQHTGIVIIDEIDAHLHPSWQQKLIDILKDSFPNVQFIIASHSPLVVAGCKENEVNVLRKNDPSGFYIQQIRRHFIGSTVDELYKTIFEIEDRDETFKKYEAMIPLKESFKKEIKEIEGTRKILSDLEDTEYDELTTRQSMLEEQVQLFNKLKARPDLDEKERVIFDRLCQDLGLSPSSTSDEIKAKAQLGDKERERLSRLSRQIALEAPAQERLENLYSNVHYIEVVEKVKKGDTTKTN